MIEIGVYHSLKILRDTAPGLFLADAEGNEVLLPNKYKPKQFSIGDSITVFVYLDYDERPVATTLTPKITKNNFAFLKVVDNAPFGSFMDWGLEKDLFVPFKEQDTRMKKGSLALIYMYEDKVTGRLVGSNKIKKFLTKEIPTYEFNQEVKSIVIGNTDIGYTCLLEGKYLGLLYENEVFKPIKIGDEIITYIKKVREDGKIDLSLNIAGYQNSIQSNVPLVLKYIEKNNGFINLTDKSPSEVIQQELGLSKKAFKQAIGSLYKSRMITIMPDGIKLIKVS